MRFLMLSSAKNPYNDFILLNGGYFNKDGSKNSNFNSFNGFLCTSFQSIGIKRKLEFLSIKNRQFTVENKPDFKPYSLTIEILSKYSEYEAKHRELITFLDRNKKDGFRLYYRPYDGMEKRYCLCEIESSSMTEKMQPITLTIVQNSLWFGEQKKSEVSTTEEGGNVFAFKNDNGYYSASFSQDDKMLEYYCIPFSNNVLSEMHIENGGYNEIPLTIRIYGECVNPVVSLFRKNEETPIRTLQVFASIDKGYYVEIDADISNNGVWYVNNETQEKVSYEENINNELGSPYFYIDNGEYKITIKDEANNVCNAHVFWKEEYSE